VRSLKITKHHFIIILWFLLFSWIPGQACCEPLPLWEAGLGVGLLSMPDYRGSDESRGYVFPFPYIIYRGEMLKIDRDSIRGLFFKADRLKLEGSLNGSVPVDSSKNKARQGMPNLDPSFEIGPSLEVMLAEDKEKGYRLSFNLPVRAVFSTDFIHVIPQGWSFSPRFDFDLFERRGRRGWNMGMGFGPVFGDQTFHNYYYRVDPAFAIPERPAYSAPGGFGGLQLTAYVGKHFNKLRLNLFARADFLNGAAFADSPLVKTNTSILAGFSISYFFWESKTLVEAEK
jgi:MipA family protein